MGLTCIHNHFAPASLHSSNPRSASKRPPHHPLSFPTPTSSPSTTKQLYLKTSVPSPKNHHQTVDYSNISISSRLFNSFESQFPTLPTTPVDIPISTSLNSTPYPFLPPTASLTSSNRLSSYYQNFPFYPHKPTTFILSIAVSVDSTDSQPHLLILPCKMIQTRHSNDSSTSFNLSS
jgi:hypothetical protein